jgi:1-acyl-sn-glycerol-3-phosphate acyltransferase
VTVDDEHYIKAKGPLPELHTQEGDAARAGLFIRVMRVVIGAIFRLLFRIRASGLEHLPRGPMIAVGNHMGWADPFLVLLCFPLEPRIYVLADHNAVGRTGFRATMMRLLKVVVTVSPDSGYRALREMDDVLKRGGSLLIFGEGAPPHEVREGHVRALKGGAAHLAIMSGTPLVPIGIAGTSELWVGRRIAMRVGEPIDPAEFTGPIRERARALTGRLERDIAALVPRVKQPGGPRLLRRWLTKVFA